jgi:hypothetical protein
VNPPQTHSYLGTLLPESLAALRQHTILSQAIQSPFLLSLGGQNHTHSAFTVLKDLYAVNAPCLQRCYAIAPLIVQSTQY